MPLPGVPQRRGSPRRRPAARPVGARRRHPAVQRRAPPRRPRPWPSPGTSCTCRRRPPPARAPGARRCARGRACEVGSDSPASSGRSPAYTPSTSSRVERRRAAPRSRARAGSRCRRADAAGCALSRSQSVSVVPMIQCRPHGITNSTRLLGAQDEPGRRTGSGRAARRGGCPCWPATWNCAALADHRLDLVGPHAGGVDDLPGADLELARRSRGRAPGRRRPARPRAGSRSTRARVATCAPYAAAVRARVSVCRASSTCAS